MVCQAKHLPENIAQPFPRTFLLPKSQPSQGHSSFRGIRCPEDASPFENIATLRPVLPSRVRWLLQPTSLVSTYIYGVCYAARSSHVSNVATTPTPTRTVTENSRNRSRHQGQNPSYYRRITTRRSCNYWNPHYPHCQWSLPGYIYTEEEGEGETIKNSSKRRLTFQ